MSKNAITRRTFGVGASAGLGLWLSGDLLYPGPALAAGGSGSAVVAIDNDPTSINPGISTDYVVGAVGAKIYEALVWLDPDYAPKPMLAVSWDASADGKTYSFKLRQGVKWHDGKPFTSADVKFTFEEVLLKLHPRMSAVLKNVGAVIETPDDNSVVFKLQKGYAPFLIQMTVFDAPILPKHIFEGTNIAANPASQNPIGTGPFKFGAWNRGSNVRLTRNENYWDAGKPSLEEVIFQIVPQGANRAAGLQTGELDVVDSFFMSAPDTARLVPDKNLQFRKGFNIPAIWFAMFNLKSPMFAKKEARQAVAMAVDRPRLVAQVMQGLARPGVGAFGDGFKWLLDDAVSYDKKYPLNPTAAKALLEKSGYDGSVVRVPFDSARPQMQSLSQILRENLTAIGMKVELQPLERAVLTDRVFVKREFDVALQSFFSASDPAIGYTRLYVTTASGTNNNASGYSDPKVDDLLGVAATAPDRAGRAAAYKQLQAILNEEVPSLVLFDEETVDFASRKVTGMWASIDARDIWAGVKRQG